MTVGHTAGEQPFAVEEVTLRGRRVRLEPLDADRHRAGLGASQEGVLRAHKVMPDGRIRDSAIYGITRPEWPGVQAALVDRLQRA
jgi:hypothetical protein